MCLFIVQYEIDCMMSKNKYFNCFCMWRFLVFNGISRQFISIMISNIACMDKRLYNKYKDTPTNTDNTNNNFLHTCISDGSSLTFWAIAVFFFILHNYFLLSWSFFISSDTKLSRLFSFEKIKSFFDVQAKIVRPLLTVIIRW